jgi:hypothetical protein
MLGAIPTVRCSALRSEVPRANRGKLQYLYYDQAFRFTGRVFSALVLLSLKSPPWAGKPGTRIPG